MIKSICLVCLMCLLVPVVYADWISINSGGSENITITPGSYIEGFFIRNDLITPITTIPGIITPSNGGGGGGQTSIESTIDVRIITPNVAPGEPVKAVITIYNPGGKQNNVIIWYYLTNPNGDILQQTQSLILELDNGYTTIQKELVIPPDSMLGEWDFIVIQPIQGREANINSMATFVVVRSTTPDKIKATLLKVALLFSIIFFMGFYASKKHKEERNYAADGYPEEIDEETK
jgi:hypothetical protein